MQIDFKENGKKARKFTTTLTAYFKAKKLEIGEWTKNPFSTDNEFVTSVEVFQPKMEVYVADESISIYVLEERIYREEIYDFKTYEEMADDAIKTLDWIIELENKGQLSQEIQKKKKNRLKVEFRLKYGFIILILSLITAIISLIR